VRKLKLQKSEVEICSRLRFAREEVLKITQAACAEQIGLDRSTLANYETARTPLRHEIALRFCRQFIISEEWLATGRHDACHAEAPRHGIVVGPGIEKMDEIIFLRQSMDLLSEPSALHIAPGTLFGTAYDENLAADYSRLVREFFYLPRIVLSDSDNPQLVGNLLNAINMRFICLLENEAVRRGQKGSSAWRVFARCLLESADLVFRKMMRFKLDSAHLNNLGWLRYCVTDADATIELLGDRSSIAPLEPPKNDLTGTSLKSKREGVKSEIDKLIADVKRKASKPGTKSELARTLGVAPARISEWLAGEKEPGGEYALRLQNWVESPSHQK
jgi:transcriptional regulator with XRE-family HTH domain